MQTRDLQDDMLRGIHAESELRETAAAFEAVRAAILKTLAETPVGQDGKVLKLHMSLQNLAAVKVALQKTVAAGEHARFSRAAEDAIAEVGLTRP